MSKAEILGVVALYTVGVAPWLRWIYVQSRPTWRIPIRVAKLHSARMTSDSDHAGLI